MKISKNGFAVIFFIILFSIMPVQNGYADLEAGSGDDGSEQEADNVAESVVSRPNPMEQTTKGTSQMNTQKTSKGTMLKATKTNKTTAGKSTSGKLKLNAGAPSTGKVQADPGEGAGGK